MRHPVKHRLSTAWLCGLLMIAAGGCSRHASKPAVGERATRIGDEIVACGQFIHTGAPVVTWMDPGGFDAYRVERRFAPVDASDWEGSSKAVKELKTPNRYGLRQAGLTPEQIEQVRGGGWPLPLLQEKVDQFVLHFDGCGTSRQCFTILQDHRDLSVHFMLDIDGTIYQTLDLKERAYHATTSNDRSIGVEIANIGAFPAVSGDNALHDWYRKDSNGHTRLLVPPALGSGQYLRTPNFIGHPIRDDAVTGMIQGKSLKMYDLTPEQYDSLISLTAAICLTFPRIKCDAPREPDGSVINHKLPQDQLDRYQGILGHYHIQENKIDPGPALQWDRVINGTRKLMSGAS